MNFSLILASQSPRRKALLKPYFKRMQVISPPGKEPTAPARCIPARAAQLVKDIAIAKANNSIDLVKNRQNYLLLSADTLVFCQGRVLGKPRTKSEAKKMLRLLSGKSHLVFTAVVVFYAKGRRKIYKSIVRKTRVDFWAFDEKTIDWYVSTNEPMDKAGAYGAQGFGCGLIKKITGSYTNVVGLPLAETLKLVEAVTHKHWSEW